MKIAKFKNVEWLASLNTGRGDVHCVWIDNEANLFFNYNDAARFWETVTDTTAPRLDND